MTKVLVVDDAAFMRLVIRTMLEKNGFEIIEAENGAAGVKKYKECNPDVVTMDITMPEMDGLKALKTIREHDPKAKIIMVSAMGQECLVKEAVMHGAKTFIVKPFQEEFIVQTITKIAAM